MAKINVSDLKAKTQSVDDIKQKSEQEQSGGQNFQDDRQWYPERDKETGNASALIRFLPAIYTELPWVKLYYHAFQGDTGQWLFKNCPTTLGKDCPVCEANKELWQTGLESNKNIVRKRKRNLVYYSNVYVKDDPQTPENNGKVFIFRFGSQIHDMLMGAMEPEFPDDPVINPFSVFDDGADLNLRIIKKNGNTNYDEKSRFSDKDVLGTDEEIEEIVNQAYDLNEFVNEDQFDSYQDINTRFKRVLGEQVDEPSDNKENTAPSDNQGSSGNSTETSDIPSDNGDQQGQSDGGEGDEDFDYIQRLANGEV